MTGPTSTSALTRHRHEVLGEQLQAIAAPAPTAHRVEGRATAPAEPGRPRCSWWSVWTFLAPVRQPTLRSTWTRGPTLSTNEYSVNFLAESEARATGCSTSKSPSRRGRAWWPDVQRRLDGLSIAERRDLQPRRGANKYIDIIYDTTPAELDYATIWMRDRSSPCPAGPSGTPTIGGRPIPIALTPDDDGILVPPRWSCLQATRENLDATALRRGQRPVHHLGREGVHRFPLHVTGLVQYQRAPSR